MADNDRIPGNHVNIIKPLSILPILLFLISAPALAQHAGTTEPAYVPQRVFVADGKKFSDFESMLADLARADMVFVGEQHDDPATHRLERAILEGVLRRRNGPVAVAMEMFERDVQPVIDDYFAGKISEEEFLKKSRPWPRYATDYRPVVEFARQHGWKLVASNVPRPLASRVSRGGLAEIDKLAPADRAHVAEKLSCPMDDYFKRFAETMSSHPGASAHGAAKPEAPKDKATLEKEAAEMKAMIERFYYAQCAKDETMGDSVARVVNTEAKPLVIHYNGAFHSDFGYGTADRAKQRAGKARMRIVSIVPVDNLDTIKAAEYRKRGDYIVFCLQARKPKEEKRAE
ncbi:MAG: ChaN family lipoprotein [Blastocatellia bacterium]